MDADNVSYWRRGDALAKKTHVIKWNDPASGKRRFKSFAKKADALAFAKQLRSEFAAGVQPNQRMPVAAAMEHYYAAKTSASYTQRYDITRALSSFRHTVELPLYLHAIRTVHVDEYLAKFWAGEAQWFDAKHDKLKPRAASDAQARKDHACLKAFFGFWVSRGVIPANPVAPIKRPTLPEEEIRVPEDEDWIRLLAKVPDVDGVDHQAWHLYLLLAIVTGLDRDDLLRVQITDFTLGDESTRGVGVLKWRRSKKRRTARHFKTQHHGLPPIVDSRVANRIVCLPDDESYLFPWRTFPRKQWDQLRQAAAFPFHFKSLRKVAGTRAVEAAALDAGARQLAHSNPAVTKAHYAAQRRVAVAVAVAMAERLPLPDLPDMPAYAPVKAGQARPQQRAADTESSDDPA